jgi:hypothetical protein
MSCGRNGAKGLGRSRPSGSAHPKHQPAITEAGGSGNQEKRAGGGSGNDRKFMAIIDLTFRKKQN